MSDDVYLKPTTPKDDLTAQIVLFILQTEVSSDPALFEWLRAYLLENFPARGTQAAQKREDVAGELLVRLLRYKWMSEGDEAWRAYVGTHRFAVQQRYKFGTTRTTDTSPDPDATEERLIQQLDGIPPRQEQGPQPPPARQSESYDPTGEFLTVKEASGRLGIAPSTLYARLDRRRARVLFDKYGLRTLSRAEVERLERAPSRKNIVDVIAPSFPSRAAAERQVSRLKKKGYSLEDILGHYAPDSAERC